MSASMKGKVAVITGGAGMIGHAAATVLARAGADVMLVDINAEALATRRGAIEALGVRVETQVADVQQVGRGRRLRGSAAAEVRPHRCVLQQRRHRRQARPDARV